MTKDEIKNKLDEAGIEYDDTAKKSDLQDLLPKQTVEEKSYEMELTVVDTFGEIKGVFSRTRQGKHFVKLANDFARNKGYTIRK